MVVWPTIIKGCGSWWWEGPSSLHTHWTHAHMPTRSFTLDWSTHGLLWNLLLPTRKENITILNAYLFFLYKKSFTERNLVTQHLLRLESSAWSAPDVYWVTGVLILIWVGQRNPRERRRIFFGGGTAFSTVSFRTYTRRNPSSSLCNSSGHRLSGKTFSCSRTDADNISKSTHVFIQHEKHLFKRSSLTTFNRLMCYHIR